MAESQNDQMQSAITCDTCEETAEHLCRTCHDRLCSKCKIVHSKSKASYDHEVVLLSSDAIALANEKGISFQQVCRKHAGSRISICCGDCEIPICEKCLLPEHSGHRVISISDLIKQKEPKLSAKYSTISSLLPQYEDKLKEIKERKSMVVENSDCLEEKIDKQFLNVQSRIEKQKTKLLKDVHEYNRAAIDYLKSHENKFEEYIKNIKTFMKDFETELLKERNQFILFGNSDVDATVPDNFPKIRFPEFLHYETESHDEAPVHSLCGRLHEGNKLHRNYTTKELQVINVGNNDITSLAYRCQDDTFLLYTNGKILQIDRMGNILLEKMTKANSYNNKPVVVSHAGTLIYRQNQFALHKCDISRFDKEFFTTSFSAPLCLWARKEGGVIVGFLDKGESDGGFFWLTEDGEIEKEIRIASAWNDVYKKYIFASRNRAYVAENVNGDICFSNRSVDVYNSNLQHRFSYPDLTDAEYFLPQDICTDDFGYILVADERNCLIHILNKDGGLLKLVKLPGLNNGYPIALTIDKNRSLCVGCSDGKIRFMDYLTILSQV